MNLASPKEAKAAALRSGAEYLAAIKDDGRRVMFEGDVVRDVTTHPAFKGAARSLPR